MERLQLCRQSFYGTELKFTMDFRLEAGCSPVRRNPGAAGARRGAVLGAWLATLVTLSPPCAWAETKVELWHAMTGELRRELERLVADFNRLQPDARIVATAKGSYSETGTSAIFAVRTHTQPAIVHDPEDATATMQSATSA